MSIAGNLTNNGTFRGGAGGTLVFNGGADQLIEGSGSSNFQNLTLNNGNTLILSQGISVDGSLTLTSGKLNIADQVLNLGDNGNIIGENNTKYVYGTTGTITATNRNAQIGIGNNIAGMGIEISTAGGLTDLDITRGMTSQTGIGNTGVMRYFDISSTPNTGLNASLTVHYLDHEFGGSNGGIDESNFVLYRSAMVELHGLSREMQQ